MDGLGAFHGPILRARAKKQEGLDFRLRHAPVLGKGFFGLAGESGSNRGPAEPIARPSVLPP